MDFWDVLTFLWNSAYIFLSYQVKFMGLDFTLWEFAMGGAVLVLIFGFIFKDNSD